VLVSRAGWGVALRRVVENVMATLPVFALLFVPIWLGRHELYAWTHAEEVAKNPILHGKSAFLNEGFWFIRAVFYFTVWSALATFFSTQSQKQDETGDPQISARLRGVAPVGIMLFALTATFATVDWMMSLEPEWYSTMFGVYYFAGGLLASFAFLTVAVAYIQGRGQLHGVVTVEHLHDIGKLLFAFTIFWTYIAFSQYFLVWYGNMPEETVYFMRRSGSGWPAVAKLLIVGHFAIPFLFLMPRAIKRSAPLRVAGAGWLLAMHFLDIYWCVMPVHSESSAGLQVVDVAAFLAVGGLFLATFGWVSARRALVPLRDPRLAESLSFENV
jgi:hypothetical protein